MEERKRPASYDNDNSEPPLKRQATSVNGGSKGHIDADMPWKDDLEVSEPCIFDATLPRPKELCPPQDLTTSITRTAHISSLSASKKMPYTVKCRNISGNARSWKPS